jgi:spermidine synthase
MPFANARPAEAVPAGNIAVTLLLSACSGIAALIYEIVWFQLLELAIGSTTLSLAILLATFMGGTCLGSWLFPRLVVSRWPALRIYAALEGGIGLLGLTVLFLVPVAGSFYSAWSVPGPGGILLRGIVAAACLLPPTMLMGATLPALARAAPSDRNRASWLGLIYGSNIAGAVLGCLSAGFYLLRHYDAVTATGVAAGINATVATVALAVAPTRSTLTENLPYSGPSHDRGESSIGPPSTWSIYAAVALSGLCALAAEAIWTRTLGLLFGASVYTFSILLAVYLFGLGIGSSVSSLMCRFLQRPATALAWCQLVAAAAITWSAYQIGGLFPYWPMDPSLSSSIWLQFQIDVMRALWAVLPATMLWGATFPLALAALRANRRDSAHLMAGVYAVNTSGAIVGALAASLSMGWLGSQTLQQILVVLSLLSAVLVISPGLRGGALQLSRGPVLVALGAVVLAPPMAALVPAVPAELIAHGRYAATWVGKGDIVYTEEGLNASVAVSRFPNGTLTFHVAGKIQASSVPRDMRLQRMLGHFTTLTGAAPRSVLVIGCGAGVTAGAVSIDPAVERVTLVEIEPVVPKAASQYFSDFNFDVLKSSKVRLHIDDGRHYLQTTTERFDAITADPLDPWVKGAANLYTKEFFEIARQRLNPGGVVTVYIQLFETNEEAVRSALATFFEVFPEGTIWGNTHEGKGHDMVLLGQAEPLRIDLDKVDRRLSLPEYDSVSGSMKEIGMNSALDLFATYAGRASDLKAWLRGAPLNRDMNLRMQYLAGTGLNLDDSARIYASVLRHRRFPEDIFVAAEEGGRNALREAILASNP